MDKNKTFLVCINNHDYPASLELNKIYRSLSDADAEQDGDLRVIDESGEDYLYPAERFVTVTSPHEVEISVMQSATEMETKEQASDQGLSETLSPSELTAHPIKRTC